ncbi:hypothetical protein [Salmonella phage NINP13076]|nr:hypothetical protein [Salmonella phage NINP13076]
MWWLSLCKIPQSNKSRPGIIPAFAYHTNTQNTTANLYPPLCKKVNLARSQTINITARLTRKHAQNSLY